MATFFTRRRAVSLLMAAALILTLIGMTMLQSDTGAVHASGAPFKDFESFMTWMQQHHKAPFDHDVMLTAKDREAQHAKILKSLANQRAVSSGTNVKVNQDRNPWPKAELGAAVDPTNGNNYVVMANDFRENFDHQFYHVSTDSGQHWTDDSMTVASDPITGGVPFNFQSDPGVGFDSFGHSYLSTINGNEIFDFDNGYLNLDTQIEAVTGYAHGTYSDIVSINVDTVPCSGLFSGTLNCPGQLDKPLLTADNVKGSPHNGTVYIYYTYFCNGAPCTDGNVTIPANSSVILESHSAGAGLPFSAPALVSGTFTNEQFSDMVIDSHGTPHIFFDDFSASTLDSTIVNMYESTLGASGWTVNSRPVATFTYNGLNNINWAFRDNGTVAPGCGISKDTAYCAFSASQIGNGTVSGTPSVYLAKVNTLNGASTISRVNNDPLLDSKDHFFPWATVTPQGNVYVGWYDNRSDPFNTKVEYWVGKSTNGGKTFPTQKAVSTASFNPCVGFPGCGFFGDYVQLVSGPDNVVHAAWSDTRDGASMQIYTQRITW